MLLYNYATLNNSMNTFNLKIKSYLMHLLCNSHNLKRENFITLLYLKIKVYKMETIDSLIHCSNCKCLLEDPIMLPCGNTICAKHIRVAFQKKEPFNCDHCKQSHPTLNCTYPPCALAKRIIQSKLRQLDLCENYQVTNKAYTDLKEIVEEYEVNKTNPTKFFSSYFGNVRTEIETLRDNLKVQIDKLCIKLLNEINGYQKECEEKNREKPNEPMTHAGDFVDLNISEENGFNGDEPKLSQQQQQTKQENGPITTSLKRKLQRIGGDKINETDESEEEKNWSTDEVSDDETTTNGLGRIKFEEIKQNLENWGEELKRLAIIEVSSETIESQAQLYLNQLLQHTKQMKRLKSSMLLNKSHRFEKKFLNVRDIFCRELKFNKYTVFSNQNF